MVPAICEAIRAERMTDPCRQVEKLVPLAHCRMHHLEMCVPVVRLDVMGVGRSGTNSYETSELGEAKCLNVLMNCLVLRGFSQV